MYLVSNLFESHLFAGQLIRCTVTQSVLGACCVNSRCSIRCLFSPHDGFLVGVRISPHPLNLCRELRIRRHKRL